MISKKKILKIRSVTQLTDYSLELVFSDNKKQIVNFEHFLKNSKHPEISKYLDKRKFKKFVLIEGELMWGDYDLIFPIIDLYENTIFTPLKNKKSS